MPSASIVSVVTARKLRALACGCFIGESFIIILSVTERRAVPTLAAVRKIRRRGERPLGLDLATVGQHER